MWMLSSNGTQATIEFFLNLIKAQSPAVLPSIFMTDRNHTQVNAIHTVFPEYQRVFYCWWHMLRVIQTHFNTREFPKLWMLIQDWVRITDDKKFNTYWTQIQDDPEVPKSMSQLVLPRLGSASLHSAQHQLVQIGTSRAEPDHGKPLERH